MEQRLKEAREFLDEVDELLKANKEDEWETACERLKELPDMSTYPQAKTSSSNDKIDTKKSMTKYIPTKVEIYSHNKTRE